MNVWLEGAHRIYRRSAEDRGGRCVNCDLDLAFLNDRDVIYLQTTARCDHSRPREASSAPETAFDDFDRVFGGRAVCEHGERAEHWVGYIKRDVRCPGPQIALPPGV